MGRVGSEAELLQLAPQALRRLAAVPAPPPPHARGERRADAGLRFTQEGARELLDAIERHGGSGGRGGGAAVRWRRHGPRNGSP